MKRFLLLLALSSVLASPALAQNRDVASDADRAEFQALVDRYARSWATLNPDKAAGLYAKDSTLVFFDIAPLQYRGWNEYNRGVRTVFATFDSMVITPRNDLRVTRHGNIAWTTGTMHMYVRLKGGGTPMEMDTRHTIIWERRGNDWVIVHEHFSAPMPN